jgi:hypothetical protein
VVENRAQALRAHLAHPVQPGLWRLHTMSLGVPWRASTPFLIGIKAYRPIGLWGGHLSH